MNEFTAKKLGEVLAFSRVGVETLEKGRQAFEQAFSEGEVQETIDIFLDQAEKIEVMVEDSEFKEITLKKSEATGSKLRAMREMYVGDEWDNPAELLEWSGFFQGAAVVHWALVEGTASTLRHLELENIASDAKDAHDDLLEDVCDALHNIGMQKAQL